MREETPPVTIRLAGPEDAGAITDMLGQLAQDLGAEAKFRATPEGIARHISGGPKALFHCLIAHSGGQPRGFTLFLPYFSTWHGQPGAYVQDLWVAPEARGSALGQRLLTGAARHAAQSWGAHFLALSVDVANDGARRFYTRLGFTPLASDRPQILHPAAFDRLIGAEAPDSGPPA